MRKIKLVLVLLLMITIAGCSDKDVTKYYHDYKGESELWEVYYHEKSVVTFWTEDGILKHDTSTEATFTALYKNDIKELTKIRQLEIGYDAGLTVGSISENYNEDGPDRRAFTLSSSNGLITHEAEIIKATLRIDDYIETIELTRK